MKMKPTKIASLVALSIASSTALADQTTELDTLVLSGGFTPVSEESYARSYTIISEEQIEQRQEKTIGDVLRQVPGLHVARSGGPGGTTEVRIRGAESNHVLVLIDGIEVANSSSAFNFANLTADHIERIEVLRGPQSALYGAGATAGVINIITKSQGKHSSISVEAVDTGGSTVSAQIQDMQESGGYSLGVTYRKENGWDAIGASGDKDGFEHKIVNFKTKTLLTNGTSVSLTSRYIDRVNEYDNVGADAGNYATGNDFYINLSAESIVMDGTAVFKPVFSFADKNNRNVATFGSTDEASTLRFSPQLAIDLNEDANAQLVLAIDIKEEKFKASWASGNLESRNTKGIAADYTNQVNDRLFVQAGVRYDNNEKFGNATSWAASTSYDINSLTSINASVGRGQTNPSFYEQGHGANIVPEQNSSWDLGISKESSDGNVAFSATYFNENLTNEISCTYNPTSCSNNTGKTDKQGVELSTTAKLSEQLTFNASYTYLDAKDASGNQKPRRPENAGNIGIIYTSTDQRYNVGLNVESASKTSQSDDFVVTDLNVTYNLSSETKVYSSVKNLFDESYAEVTGYGSQPRTVYLGIKHSW